MKSAIVLILAALATPVLVDSCGPFVAEAVFTLKQRFAPLDFNQGKVGILRPTFRRADLLLAYRTLSGIPLGQNESLPVQPEGSPPFNRAGVWLNARLAVPGLPSIPSITADRKVPGSAFEVYPNCLTAAFETAAATLHDRIAQWGASSPLVAEWVRAQDMVFQNCAGPASIPEPSSDPVLAPDRAYQIAAAEFYAEHYADAEAAFDAIAAGPASPWRAIAPYLAARACIREATIGHNQSKLLEARDRLRALGAAPAAVRLQGFVEAQLNPQERLVELSKQLMQPGLGPRLDRVTTDFTTIWDKHPPADGGADLIHWIATFQAGKPAAADWRERQSLPWLIAALAANPAVGPATPDLIAAAQQVPPQSPAWASVTYYGIRTEIRAGEFDAARGWADRALAALPPDPIANQLKAERLYVTRDWPGFLRFAERKVVAVSYDDDSEPDPGDLTPRQQIAFDRDVSRPMNTLVPLPLWIDAAASRHLTPKLRADIAQAGWVRAVLLNRPEHARTLAGQLSRLRPELAAPMNEYLAENDPAAARFYAVFLMLRAPGFEPDIRPGFGRTTRPLRSDLYRDNGWSLKPQLAAHPEPDDLAGPGRAPFLTPAQRKQGEAERDQILRQAANSADYLIAATLRWAQTRPDDPRLPEALHLAVNAGHYRDATPATGPLSKRAFELLHLKYPASLWAQKTKYWYANARN